VILGQNLTINHPSLLNDRKSKGFGGGQQDIMVKN